MSLEILTVLGAGPMCCYILKQLAGDDPARHYWIIVLSTAELYGGYVPLCEIIAIDAEDPQMDDLLPGMAHRQPESKHIERAASVGLPCRKSSGLTLLLSVLTRVLAVYERHVRGYSLTHKSTRLTTLRSWVGVPLWLMYDSYTHIAGSLRAVQAAAKPKSKAA